MTPRVVVGIDGSKDSIGVLDWAATEAVLGNRELEIVHVIESAEPITFPGVRDDERTDEGPHRVAADLLTAARHRVLADHPHLVCHTRYEVGRPAEVLRRDSAGAAALVLGRRGLGAVVGLVLGSVTGRLAAGADCPVFVVPGVPAPAAGPVVVGIDDSGTAVAAARVALAEARLRGTRLRAVTAFSIPAWAVPVEPDLVEKLADSERAEARRINRSIIHEAADGGDPGVEVEEVLVEASPPEAILDAATDAVLLVVGSHGRGLAGTLLLGSVSRRVLHDADRPVVVVGPTADRSHRAGQVSAGPVRERTNR